jgi:alpha-galactosidase
VLERCMAGSLLIDERQNDVVTFEGMWGAEFHMRREALGSALWLKENRRGRTSHDTYPGLVLEREGSLSIGAHLAWCGNHLIAIDRLDDGRHLLHMGELFEPGEMRLERGESYDSPEMLVVFAEDGIDGIRSAFHAHVRDAVLTWPGGAMKPRPVILNTWEGTYFKHDVENLKRQATAAAALGIERFVLDDGWFGQRDDDTTSLGDWFIDPRKYPHGLGPLVDHVTGLGMEFGIWFEPEMINLDSDLARAHPDWVMKVEGRPMLPARHQYVIDLSRPDASDHVFDRMHDILSTHAIAYIKWDMNRDLTHAAGADGRPVMARQTRAFLALLKRVRSAHPDVEIETCSSGGGRADYAALSHAHRVWVSDCTDALERLEMQRGASIFLPPEVMGSHVSAAPNHQTGRRHSLAFRALMALPYHLGIELDPLGMTAEEMVELSGYIALHKRLRGLFHHGAWFRHPVIDGRHVFGVRSADGRHATIIVAQSAVQLREMPAPVRVPGLARDTMFRLSIPAPQRLHAARVLPEQRAFLAGGVRVSGGMLGDIGFQLPTLYPESAVLIEFTVDPSQE